MDLLAELREERGKHGAACFGGVFWPCPTARALDVAIAAAELHQTIEHRVAGPWCDECEDDSPCSTLEAMTAAWEKGR